jgi:hypothetical protein
MATRSGVVAFEPICTDRTRVNLKLLYDSEGVPAAEEDSLKKTCKDFRNSWRSGRDVDRLGQIPR